MTPAVKQELIAAQLDPGLMKAVEEAASGSGRSSAPASPPAVEAGSPEEEELPQEPKRILDLYRKGRMPEAFAAIKEDLERKPDNVWLQCAFGEASLGLRQPTDARKAVQMLRRQPGEDAASCARGLEDGIADAAKQAEIRKVILYQLHAGDDAGAHQSIDRSVFSPGQQLILHHYVDRSQVSFATALGRLGRLSQEMPGASGQIDTMRKEVRDEAAAFQQLRSRAEKYLYSPISCSTCTPESAREVSTKSGYVLEEYLEVARILMERYPNYPLTGDVYFHALLLSAPYESARDYGMAVLRRNRALRLPFFSQVSPFWLVFDQANQRLRVERHPVYTTNTGNIEGLLPHRSFDVPFGEIASLKQTVGLDLTVGRLAPKTEALRLGQDLVAPYPAFSHFLYCLYGEKAVREYLWKVGRFTADVLDLPESKVSLPDPGKHSRDWINLIGQVGSQVTIGAVTAIQNSGFKRGSGQQNVGYTSGNSQTNFVLRQNLMEAANSLLQVSTMIAELHKVTAEFQSSDYQRFRSYLIDRAIAVIDAPSAAARLRALEDLLKQ